MSAGRLIRAGGLAVAAALAAAPAGAVLYTDAQAAAPFLRIGQGARASGMGEAFTAVADDSTAVYWNPAGLAQLDHVEAQFTHNSWIDTFRSEYFGVAVPAAGTWAAAYSILDLGKFDRIDAANNSLGLPFEVNDQFLMLGYGRRLLGDVLMVGAAGKLIKEDLGDGISDRAASLDGGLLARPWGDDPNVTLGFAVQNLGGHLMGVGLPLGLRGGAAWRLSNLLFGRTTPAQDEMDSLSARTEAPWLALVPKEDAVILSAEALTPESGRVEIHVGGEYRIAIASLRAGYRYRFPSNELGGLSGLTLGAGIRGRGIQFDYGFDYSYAPYGELGDSSRFSLLVMF